MKVASKTVVKPCRSLSRPATIDDQSCTGHKAGCSRGEEDDHWTKFLNGPADVDSCVIDQHINASEFPYDRLDHGFDLLGVGHIDCNTLGTLPCCLCDGSSTFLCLLMLAAGHRDTGAGFSKGLGHHKPQSTIPASDQCDATI